MRGEVRFEDVWFRYDEDAWTLRDIDLDGARRARAPRSSARRASGKTTLGYLAARLYDPERGRACAIDGIDMRDLTFASLADAVGVVSQETYLFHASVRENLRFARPDATDEEIEDAARAAQIHDTIAALPDGYDTVVGERGFRFSGGEKQRIAIARTVLRNPPVLVLDEATRALDVQTERAVERGARAARRGPHHDRHRPPPLDRPRRRPDRRARPAARSSSAARTRSCSRSAAATRRWSRATKAPVPAYKDPAAPLAPAGDARAAAGRQCARDLAGTGPKAAILPENDLNPLAGSALLDVGPDVQLIITVGAPSTITPPWAVGSPMRAAGLPPIITFVEPMMIESGGPTHVHMSPDAGGGQAGDQHGRARRAAGSGRRRAAPRR